MPIHRTDIGKAELLKDRIAQSHAFEHIFGPFGPLAEGFGQERHRTFCGLLEVLHAVFGVETRQIG